MVVAYYIVVIIIDTYLIVIAGVIMAGILMLMGFLKDRFYLKKPIKKIMILGSKGKMGKYFVNAFKEKYLILEVDQNETLTFMNALEQKPDLILDFSLAGEETSLYLKEALKKRIPIISGVTGRKKEVFRELEKLSRKYKTSFIYKPNYTKGIFFIKEWLESISDFGYKFRLEECHLPSKKDTPSGTALYLAETMHISPQSIVSNRIENSIPTHKIIIESESEEVVIMHKIKSKEAYLEMIEKYLKEIEKRYILDIAKVE